MDRPLKLRRVTMEHVNRNIHLLEIAPEFEGNELDCVQYADRNGFKWKPNRDYLFGGYWNNASGETLMPT